MTDRAPKRGVDYDMFKEGWTADCAYCGDQVAARTMAATERAIKVHIREDHPERLKETG